jgi:hypothetical protein
MLCSAVCSRYSCFFLSVVGAPFPASFLNPRALLRVCSSVHSACDTKTSKPIKEKKHTYINILYYLS